MAVIFQLPPDVERRLRDQSADLDAEAREASVLELFRRGRLSHADLSRVLGLSRQQTDAFLFKHKTPAQTGLTDVDMEMEHAVLDKILGPPPVR